jgi:HK97 family phage prohead protease
VENVRTINTISDNAEEYRNALLTALEKGEKPRVVKSFNVGYKEFNDAERTITAYCTTIDRDRFGDTVQPGGMKNQNYRRNPVVLWAHNYTIPPIAKSLWEKPDSKGVRMKMQFDVRDEAMEVYRLYKEGYLNAFSIGFLPIEYEQVFEGKSFTGFNFTEWELIENSAVPVPANPAALQDAYEKGMIRSDLLIKGFGDACPSFQNFIDVKRGAHSASGETASKELAGLIEKLNNMEALVKSVLERIDGAGSTAELRNQQRNKGAVQSVPKAVETLEANSTFDPAGIVEEIALREVSRIQGKLF